MTGAVSQASVAATLGVLVLSNETNAVMRGSVQKAASLDVEAKSEYPNVIAATAAASLGAYAGVSVSLANTSSVGKMTAAIDGSASVTGVGTINVKSVSNSTANAMAATVAGGLAGVGVNVASAINRNSADTYIGKDASVTGAGTINVKHESASHANTGIIGLAVGAGAVQANTAIANNALTTRTYVGSETGEAGTGSIAGTTLNIESSSDGAANAGVISVAGGSVGVGVNALIVLNNVDAKTGVMGKNVDVGALNVTGTLNANATAALGAANVGGAAIGLGVSYVGMRGSNQVILDSSNAAIKAKSITANAKSNTLADTTMISVNAGGIAGGLNLAISDNKTVNNIHVTGKGTLTADNALALKATGTAQAKAALLGLAAGSFSAQGSFATSVLRNNQSITADASSVKAGSLTAESELNKDGGNTS